MNLQHLKYLVEIVDCQSMTRAAKRLYVSQPYLSKVVSELEQRVGDKLFIRHSTGLEPTKAGRRLYFLAQSILHQVHLIEEMGDVPQASPRQIKLSISVAELLLKDSLMLEFLHRSEGALVELDFAETTVETALHNVSEGVSELAILVVNDYQMPLIQDVTDKNGMEVHTLDHGPMYYHLHRDHPLADLPAPTPEEWLSYPLVHLTPDLFSRHSNQRLKEEHPTFQLTRRISVNHYHTFLNVIKTNGAFAVGNKWQTDEMKLMSILSKPVTQVDLQLHLLLVKKQSIPLSPPARTFLGLFREAYGLDEI